jgi:hypothetical protein
MASESLQPQQILGGWRVSVVRPEDLLVLTVGFAGLNRPTREGRAWLESASVPGHPQKSYIILEFPGQSIAEETFFQKDQRYPVKRPASNKDPDEGTDLGAERLRECGPGAAAHHRAARQRLALAESAEPGDTSFEAGQVVLGAHVRDDDVLGATADA